MEEPVEENKTKLRSNDFVQLGGCLHRIALEKRRNIRITFCECFSHLLLIIILVQGYGLSKILHYDSYMYSEFILGIPSSSSTFSSTSSSSSSTTGVLSTYQSLVNGPLIVPTFDEYIYASRYLASSVGKQTGALLTQTNLGRSFTNLLYVGTIHFAPAGKDVDSLINYLRKNTQTFKTVQYYIHSSEKSAVDYILRNLNTPTLALIVLRQVTVRKVNYVIRQNYTTLPNTNIGVYRNSIGLNQNYQNYIFSGFMTIQKTVDEWAFAYTNVSSKPNCSPPNVVLTPFPTYSYDQNPFYNQVGFLLGLAMVMSTLYPVSRLVKSVVEEKEIKMREVMKIMGLRDWAHQLSWFLSAFVLFFWITISFTYISSTSFLVKSSPVLLFIYFFLLCMSEINFAFFVSVFFSNSKLASIVAPVALFGALMPRYAFLSSNENEQVVSKVFACLLSPTAFSFGADVVASLEYTGEGVQFNNMWDGDFSFGICLFMMFIDFYIYGFLAWYLDQVLPQEYGTPKPLLFFLSYNFWCPGKGEVDYSVESATYQSLPEFRDVSVGDDVDSSDLTESVERLQPELYPSVKVYVQGLRKRYPDGKLAVKDLSMLMLENQITCLLGHNGAGKTTTISTLTGLIEATAGTVRIYGRSLKDDLHAIRQMTGVCPQHNVLFLSLTVQEHLFFFGKIKGLMGTRLHEAADKVLLEVGLTEKRHVLASALSGGMKRKLSLCIALVGDPKFVLLDEPTSGMDPYSRRSTWELLQRSKKGRVVLLTTHFMEEADTLADRIVIMSEGKLRCCGSSLFLKTRFGAGYLLSISKTRAEVDAKRIEDSIKEVVSAAKINSSIAGEVIFHLPLDSVSLFPALFTMLKQSTESLGIGSYGISITTLESVFISLAKASRLEDSSDPVEEMVPTDAERTFIFLYSVGRYLRRLCGLAMAYIWSSCVEEIPFRRLPFNKPKNLEAVSQTTGRDIEMTAPKEVVQVPSSNDSADSGVKEDPRSSISIEAVYNDNEEKKADENNINPALGGSNGTAIPSDEAGEPQRPELHPLMLVGIQCIELFRKRYIIARRDLKGFFFQVLFPAIQIMLVLLILTINVNPAGHTITLNAGLFKKKASLTPLVEFAGTFTSDISRRITTDSTITARNVLAYNSTQMSGELLATKKKNRYGAYVFGDTVPAKVTVDWAWVRSAVKSVDVSDVTINVTKYRNDITATVSVGSLLGFGNGQSLPSFKFNLSSNQLAINSILQNRNIFSLLPSQLNVTNVFSRANVSLSRLLRAANVGNVNANAKINVRTVRLNLLSNLICLNGINGTVFVLKRKVNVFQVDKYCFTANIIPMGIKVYESKFYSKYTVMHNSTGPHGIAGFAGEITAATFQSCAPAGLGSVYLSKNHPLPITPKRTIEIQVILALLTSIFILVPLSYIPASFVSFLVKERVSKSKHLQIVSSVSPYLYWVATFAWDMFLFMILIAFLFFILVIFNLKKPVSFVSSAESSTALFLLLLTFGASSIAISYLYSLTFENFSTAQISIMAINFFTGFVFVLAYYIMISIPETRDFGAQIVNFFRLFPPYNMGEGLINLSTNYYTNTILRRNRSYFDWTVAGRSIVFMLAEAIGYFACILLTEFSPLHNVLNSINRKISQMYIPQSELLGRGAPTSTDKDVQEEADSTDAVENPLSADYSLLIRHVGKLYPPSIIGGKPKYAVRNISLGCRNGERFGLLGINGAGKTTTLSILTGDIQQTYGDVYIGGKPLSDPNTRKMIGYCPQVDPLLDLMNGYETLFFFGRIRGMPVSYLNRRVSELLKEVGLMKFAHKPCGTYSGGNKRKLSLAVALIGDPAVLFLDEPSTGMDPEARRSMWAIIEKVSATRSVVLVSHSMEEVEALCTRMCVMVSGRMQCIGSVQHLKGRFGGGYQMEVRTSTAKKDECLALCEQILPGAVMEETHGGYFRMKVQSNRQLDLAEIFRTMEENRDRLDIFDYSVSQCTLEQIFLQFAKDQEEEQAAVAGMTISSNSAANNPHIDVSNVVEYKPLEVVDEV